MVNVARSAARARTPAPSTPRHPPPLVLWVAPGINHFLVPGATYLAVRPADLRRRLVPPSFPLLVDTLPLQPLDHHHRRPPQHRPLQHLRRPHPRRRLRPDPTTPIQPSRPRLSRPLPLLVAEAVRARPPPRPTPLRESVREPATRRMTSSTAVPATLWTSPSPSPLATATTSASSTTRRRPNG